MISSARGPLATSLALAAALAACMAAPSCGGSDESLGALDEGAGGQAGAAAASGGNGGGAAPAGGGGEGGSSGGQGGAWGNQAGGSGSSGAGPGGAAGGGGSEGGASGSSGATGSASGAGGAASGAAGAGGSSAAGGSTGGTSGAAGGGSLGEFCSSTGSTIPLPSGGCTGDLGKKTFLFALCSCSAIKANNKIVTDSIDSSTGQSTGKNGSVGVLGGYDGQEASIGGSLWVDGAISMGNKHQIAVELQCGGSLDTHASEVSIATDAHVEGDILEAQGKLSVGKTLFIPPGVAHDGVVAGAVVEGPVDVAPPCDCDDLIDVAALVTSFAQGNDNQASGVTAGELSGLTAPLTRELPCGRYYFTGIESTSAVTVKLTGHTALFVDGDVHASGPLSFELGPGAELDLFISGALRPDNAVSLGDKARPAATRVYVAGEVVMSGALSIAANLYLPNTVFAGKNTVEMWGALYAKGLSLDGAFTVHYDEAILEVPGCPGAGGSSGASGAAGSGQTGQAGQGGGQTGCISCKGCDNPTPACNGGVCGKCTQSSDCCPPLLCDTASGSCVVPGGKP